MPTFTEVYNCLLAHGRGYAQGPHGGEYDLYARLVKGVPAIVAEVRNGGYVYIHEDCWGKGQTCKKTWAGGIYNNSPHSIYDWYQNNCHKDKHQPKVRKK